MAPRKNRSWKTADRMAAYKERMEKDKGQGERASTPRKSPRRALSKTRSDGSCNSPPRPSKNFRCVSPQKDPSVRKKGVEDVGSVTRLEDLVEVPETPPRESQVVGRKRSLAPHLLRVGSSCPAKDSDDNQKPSKKLKSFNTPPRGDVRAASLTSPDRNSGSISDPSVLHDTCRPSNQFREGILNMSLIDGEGTSSRNRDDSDQIHSDLVFRSRREPQDTSKDHCNFREHEDLDYISNSTAALSRQFQALKKKVLEEMRGLYRQKTDLREMQESIVKPLLSEVRDLRGVLEMISNVAKGSGSGKSCAKTSLHEWEDKLNQLTPKAEVVFNKEVFARILCFNAPWKVCEVFDTANGSLGSRVSTAAQVLIFSHQLSSKKQDFSDGFGKLHSEFKYSVIQNSFYNVCKTDTFGLFRPTLLELAEDVFTLHTSERSRISRPTWLQASYVNVEHINEARNFIESVNQSRKGKIRGTPTPDDVASHGALRVYRQLGAHLHRGRDYMKMCFFQNLGYLFVPWKGCVKDNDQREMVLRFLHDENNMLSTFTLEDISCTDLCSFGAGSENTSQVDTHNRDFLKRMFSEWPCMVLSVEHDVHVSRGGGGHRRRPGGERRKLRRLINLIGVACNVLVEYTRVGSTDLLLRGHRCALRCVMIFALLIRELTVEFIAMREAIEPDPEDPEKTVPDAELVVVHHTSLKGFLPGRSVHETQLGSKFLHITEKMYDTWNVDDHDVEPGGVAGPDDPFIATEIAESNEYGVAAI